MEISSGKHIWRRGEACPRGSPCRIIVLTLQVDDWCLHRTDGLCPVEAALWEASGLCGWQLCELSVRGPDAAFYRLPNLVAERAAEHAAGKEIEPFTFQLAVDRGCYNGYDRPRGSMCVSSETLREMKEATEWFQRWLRGEVD
jgi:hypothetical protein